MLCQKRVQCYILATECAIGTLCPLLYSAQGESADTNNSVFDFCAIWSFFTDTVTFD